jgi:predicted HTH domain antitoxin
MILVIPDELLQTDHISEADLKLEVAILLFQQRNMTLEAASQFIGMNELDFQQILSRREIPFHPHTEDCPQELTISEPALAQPTQAEILQRIEQRRTFAPAQHHLLDTLTLIQDDRAR